MPWAMKILVASQEPGASRGLVPVVKAARAMGHELLVSSRLWGAGVFQDAGEAVRVVSDDLTEATQTLLGEFTPNVVLTGLAGELGNSLDLAVQDVARNRGVPRTALLDASMYYLDRVAGPKREPFYYLPDKIFVLNDFTRCEMLAEGFPPARIVATGQPVYDYLAAPRGANASVVDLQPRHVVFFSEGLAKETLRRPEHDVGYDEEVVVPLLIEILTAFASDRPISLTIKRHPKEHVPDRTYAVSPGLSVTDIGNADPAVLMLGADLICGMSSSLLLEAWIAGKPVVSLQPGLCSWNRLVLCRANIITAALDADQAREAIRQGLNGIRSPVKPSEWCPGVGTAALAIINELVTAAKA
jgi:hypothetical protein